MEAVYAAGFGSYPQFYKVFAEIYGQGPRACLRDAA
jgi:methylphosphotriester-DNA--protein-cysteine methyltransferase